MNGTMEGTGCDTPTYVADVFLMSILLFLGTFLLSVELKDFKNALFFPSKVSTILAGSSKDFCPRRSVNSSATLPSSSPSSR
jgi:sodium bicarbonate transporter 10